MNSISELHRELDELRHKGLVRPSTDYHSASELEDFARTTLYIKNFTDLADHARAYVTQITPTIISRQINVDDAMIGMILLGFFLAKYEDNKTRVPEL